MKAKTLWIVKACISGCIALVILNLLTAFYRGGSPVIADETMSAPVRHTPNSYFSIWTEGHSVGFYDNNGFNNAYPPKGNIDYLFLGSSQMEALQVMPNENCVYRLNEILDLDVNDSNQAEYAYSLGTSGEHLTQCIQRVSSAISTYRPSKAVIFETGSLDFPQDEIDSSLEKVSEGELLLTTNNKIMSLIRGLPYLRLIYTKMDSLTDFVVSDNDASDNNISSNTSDVFDTDSYIKRISPLLDKLATDTGVTPPIRLKH